MRLKATVNYKSPLTIIGCGASATLFLAHFIFKAAPDFSGAIDLYDREGLYARGIAYSTRYIEHLLNVRASGMSAFQDEPEHFVRWLSDHGFNYTGDDFVPRKIYGDYMESLFEAAIIKIRKNGGVVRFYQSALTTLPQKKPVIVATGNADPVAPKHNALTSEDGYYNQPWQADYTTLSSLQHIVILGTGLSMVDTVLSLKAHNYRGQITCVSRRGLLPATHLKKGQSWPDFIKNNNPGTVREMLKLVKNQVAQAKEKNISWQAVIDSLRPHTNRIWEYWPEEEQNKFLRFFTFWAVHRHRMAPAVATQLQAMRDDGILKIERDHLAGIEKTSDGLKITGSRSVYHADAVINCLGFKASKSLPIKGDEIYAIGPARTYCFPETTAIPEIRAQANEIAMLLGKKYE